MSEHEDIDSDFVHPHESDYIDSDYVHPNSERSIISGESDDNDEPYYSSDSSMKHQEITQVYDRINSSDDDSVDIYSDSDNEGKHESSNTSPTSSMSFSGREESTKVDNNKKKDESAIKKVKKGFFGKFFQSRKPNPINMEVPKKRNSDLSDADIESALTSEKGYSSTESEFSIYEDSSNSQSQSHSRSQSTHYVSESETSATSSMVSPRRSLHKDRISTLPDVEEGAEGEEDTVEEYRTYRRPMAKDPDEKEPPQEIELSKDDGESNSKPEIPPEQTPDPVSPKFRKSKASSIVSPSPKSNTKSSKKKKKKKQKKKAHASALAARNHAVSSRIDYAGQISSATMSPKKQSKKQASTNSNTQLEAEVHRLRTLVELMMTRMELYERQTECLVETSLQQDREWKMTTIEHYEEAAKKRTDPSGVDERLHSMASLVAERNIQDKWIRQLECIQRGYEDRLATTENQLKDLRYQHVLTNKRIINEKKNGCDFNVSTRTPDTLTEDITTSTKSEYHYMNEATTPRMANGMSPVKRWVAPTLSGTTLSGTFTGTFSEQSNGGNGLDDTIKSNSTTQSLEPRGIKEYTSLLEEMIVSWNNNGEDVSVLSDHGTNKAKKQPKKDKKKKKKKRSSKEIK